MTSAPSVLRLPFKAIGDLHDVATRHFHCYEVGLTALDLQVTGALILQRGREVIRSAKNYY